MNGDRLVVAYSSDDNYAQHVGISMLSLFENNKKYNEIVVFIIDNNIGLENKKKIFKIGEQYKRKIKFIDFDKFRNKLNLDIGNSISISLYCRLMLASMIGNEFDKVIYFDSDSVILESLDELWNLNLDDYYVAGVLDTVAKGAKLKIGLKEKDNYVNSGMLLINLKRWRKDNIEEKFLDFIKEHNGNVYHHDQGVINGVLNKKILIINPKYNCNSNFYIFKVEEIKDIYMINDYYSQQEVNEAIDNPIFLHYTPGFFNRPWMNNCKHPLKKEYIKYKELSPWKQSDLFTDNRKWKIKFLVFLYYILPKKAFIRLYKEIVN